MSSVDTINNHTQDSLDDGDDPESKVCVLYFLLSN